MFPESIKFYTFHCHMLKRTDAWKRCFIKQTGRINGFYFSESFTATFELVFVLTQKNGFFRGFILQQTYVFLKNSTMDFQNSPLLEKSVCFYATTTGYFEHFQYLNLETNFLENVNLFQKIGALLFS